MPILLPNPRYQALELFYPGRRLSTRVRIDWSHRLTKGLVASWVFSSGKLINLVPISRLGEGSTSFYTEGNQLIGPSVQANGDSILSHPGLDIASTGGSLVVGLFLDSYISTYGTIACLDDVDQTPSTRGFSVHVQGTDVMTHHSFGNAFSGTARLNVSPLKRNFVISASSDPSENHKLIINGKKATLTANDWWRHEPGLGAANTYNSQRGKVVGKYDFYHVFDREIAEEDLYSLNRDPYQFVIPDYSTPGLSVFSLDSGSAPAPSFRRRVIIS